MLQELTIKNFAIIESLSLSFEEGMTVMTGETGAGKSIIIDALGLIVGGRGSSQLIRHGADKLALEALFYLEDHMGAVQEQLEENGIDATDRMLVLERVLFRSGKNTCRVNGKLVTTVFLRELGSKLIDIHSQHESQELMHDEYHLGLLDRFDQKALAGPLATYRRVFEAYQEADKKWRNWTKNEQEMARRLDMLRFQNQEIEASGLKEGEEEELLEQKNILANFEKLNENLAGAYEALQGEPGGMAFVSQAMSQLESIQSVSEEYRELSESVSSSYYMLEDALRQIGQALDNMEFQPEELNQIEARLAEMNQLKRKYGKTIHDIIQYNEEIKQEITTLSESESSIDQLAEKRTICLEKVRMQAAKLTALRKKAALRLETQIGEELKQLYMEKAVFKVMFKEEEVAFTADGSDQVSFYMSTNPGEPPKPLTKIASGGELSRMMLALKTIFSKHQGITSIIFDEVDTGVSGRVAQAIAEKIYAVSIGSQVLCITHLPQVAAMADHHFYITKQVQHKRTLTHVAVLNGEEKTLEISRMIAGTEVTDLAKRHAKEMLDQAAKIKQLSQ
ncbi:DNA repair protein RecN [Listeria ilorinensis]|uniref:DNA repair protein RecN n=1 Tax=Listeria ilorinensis TaxID=2867439 RepID=UPI001EF4D72F|nr:DNA repair protein RecN [Listeria ilorinensis]